MHINNLRDSATQSEKITFISGERQRRSLSHNNVTYSPPTRFLVKRQTGTRNTPRTREFIKLRNDHHAWTDQNSLTGKGRKRRRNKFNKVVLHKITFKMHLKCLKSGY